MGTALDTVAYSYYTGTWRDKLIGFDGREIAYDNVGNPYRDGIWRYTWEHGRQLKTMTSMADSSLIWSYTYDANGMRTGRTNGTDTYTYVYNGGQLVSMKKNNDTLNFSYDASGVMSVTYNGTVYQYVTNLQGDIVAIISPTTGEIVAEYTYDAWGNILSIGGSMEDTLALINPLRYRGYVYDQETGLYYLQSRYYNPNMGRFINADGYVATGQGTLGGNMFAYCGNNPVTRVDVTGCLWKELKEVWNNFWGGVKDALTQSKEDAEDAGGGTTTVGANASAAAGPAVGASIGSTKDNKGNVGIAVSVSMGGGFPSAGISGFHSKTTAPNIYAQEGWGMQIGGSVGEGLVVGAEYNLLVDSEAGDIYHGRTYNIGGGANIPVPGEIHAEINYTWVFGFNVYDFWIGITDFLIWDD